MRPSAYLISPNTLPSDKVANIWFSPPNTCTMPLFTIYISLPTSPYNKETKYKINNSVYYLIYILGCEMLNAFT